MILLRPIEERDAEAMERLAQVPGMFNLAGDRDQQLEKIARSKKSFAGKHKHRWEDKFIFVAEDTETGKVVGTSMIAAQHGTPESPHFFFEVSNEERFSETINTGFIHGTLKLRYDPHGPSEIGALVIDPEMRKSDAKLGRQISFVRFLYLALHRARFQRRLIAELLPPLNKRGQSPLWEAVGRRFTSMDYWEADALCAKNKEFIFSLFPSGKIYTTFLPAEARNAIGKVGKDTEPVVHMLKKIGFQYRNEVDPFDGGPHLWSDVEEIVPVKKTKAFTVNPLLTDGEEDVGLICPAEGAAGFKAMQSKVMISGDQIRLENLAVAETLQIREGSKIHFMPYY